MYSDFLFLCRKYSLQNQFFLANVKVIVILKFMKVWKKVRDNLMFILTVMEAFQLEFTLWMTNVIKKLSSPKIQVNYHCLKRKQKDLASFNGISIP